MKLIFIILLVLCICAFGQILASKHKARVKTMENFISFMYFCKSEIKFKAGTPLTIVKEFNRLYPQRLVFLNDAKEPVAEYVGGKLDASKELTESEKELIKGFFKSFGISDESAQLNLIENYKNLSENDLKNARAESSEKVNLITKLSFLGALAGAVILI